MRNLFKCTVVQSKPVVSVISVWFYGSVYMCFKWLYKKCLMKSRLRRFVDGTWYEDRTNGHALAKVYPSSRTLFHVAMYRIHVYPRALFRLAGTSRPCMTYKSNPFSVIQAGRALTVRLWSDWCFAGNVEVCTLTSHINVSGHISQPRVCDRYKTLHINTLYNIRCV